MGFADLSVDSAITRSTPWSIAALTMFSAPRMLVLMHSIGLYSDEGICLSAAACTTTFTPERALCSLASSRTSPMKKRRRGSGNRSRISDCLSSSREYTTRRSTLVDLSACSTKAVPNDPVAPVTSTLDPSSLNGIRFHPHESVGRFGTRVIARCHDRLGARHAAGCEQNSWRRMHRSSAGPRRSAHQDLPPTLHRNGHYQART